MNTDIDINKISGGLGCDVVSGVAEYTARKGRIYAIIANEDDSRIENITESVDIQGARTDVLAIGRSYMSTKKVVRITLAGTSGTCTIVHDGVTKTCTWDAEGLTATAAAFVAANAADYLAAGWVLTSDGAVLIFTSSVAGEDSTGASSGANATGDLAGTAAVATANKVFAINENRMITPDNPASKFTPGKGSFYVYYTI
jgi:hypothetical protein